MSGPTLVVPSRAVESSTPFHASHSAPNLLAASGSLHNPPPSSLGTVPVERSPGFKSLPGLAAFDIPSFDLITEFESSFSFTTATETLPSRPATANEKTGGIDFKNANVVVSENEADNEIEKVATGVATVDRHIRNRSKSMIDRPVSWLPSSKSAPNVRTVQEQGPKRLVKQNVAGAPGETLVGKPVERTRAVESFADYAKRSWMSKSRSPSPPTKPEKTRGVDRASSAERPPAIKAKSSPASQNSGDATGAAEPPNTKSRLNRASLYLTKIKQKPRRVFSRSTSSPPVTSKPPAGKVTLSSVEERGAPQTSPGVTTNPIETPATPAVPRNASHNSINSAASRTPSQTASSVDTELDTDTATASTASENASQSTAETNVTMPHPTSRDPLWATFRTLDLEFPKFAGKTTTSARMAVVRSMLMPFLRSTAYHPSNSNRSVLTSEDTDRRATILNKWWNGLLAMLAGGNLRLLAGIGGMAGLGVQFPPLQPVAGVDRPTLLEATTMIMMRPEWRSITKCFQPLAERCPDERVRARSGTHSTVGSEPDSLLAESAEHNVRTMFVTNLTAQMALVVEKLSLRHAPLSLVNWCGKACAYAFFFVPGIADVLVRLWGLNANLLRRVADEFGLPRRSKGESDDIVALFPSHLYKLGWSSVKSLADKLRLAAKLPLLLAKIHWHGPWMSRWRGGDTDLLFIFCKYFYVLAEEFMPTGLPLVEKARSPAFVLIHAQLLSILDSTIHRQASIDALGPPLSDALHGSDAAITAPQISSNLLRGMDENRLVVLLKDMLTDHSAGVAPAVKHTFAEAIVGIAKAAAKRTPQFEHASCFMLCDFLEEALVALDAFQNTLNNSVATSPTEEFAPRQYFEPRSSALSTNYIDWPFWFEVGKLIMNSNNTMSEIRIMSFLYSVWDAITADPSRKEALCLDWLLSEEVFAKFFNHWCPMVRAYYMRLLCWRVCRDTGSANEVDIKIFLVVSQRLKTVWSHYLWLKQDASAKGRMHPSTAPSYPAPGKRFLIIRTEVQPPQHSLQLGFDTFSSSFTSFDYLTDLRGSAAGNGDSGAGGQADGNMSSFKKRWSLLGRVLPFGASGSPTSDSTRSWEEELEQARRDTAASRLTSRGGSLQQPQGPPPPPPKQGPSMTVMPSSDSGSSTGSAPTFDAGTFVFRFTLTWQAGPNGGAMPCGPTRDRILTRPRLPAPSQSRVSARSACRNSSFNGGDAHIAPIIRSDSPPPISPGLPPVTRRVSGVLQTGLISEARNARPLSVAVADEPRKSVAIGKLGERLLSLSISVTPIRLTDDDGEDAADDDRLEIQSPIRVSSGFAGYESADPYGGLSLDFGGGAEQGPLSPQGGPAIRPERPMGVYAPGAVYAGRAMAEWSVVVSECNSFVDRRRDEGVLGLSEVEVPSLGVEGLGIRQRG